MILVQDDSEFIKIARREIVDICSDSPELTEVMGGFILKYLRSYRRHREFDPGNFRLGDLQFTRKFSGSP